MVPLVRSLESPPASSPVSPPASVVSPPASGVAPPASGVAPPASVVAPPASVVAPPASVVAVSAWVATIRPCLSTSVGSRDNLLGIHADFHKRTAAAIELDIDLDFAFNVALAAYYDHLVCRFPALVAA